MVKISTWIIDTDSILVATDIALRLEKKFARNKGKVQYNGEPIKWWANTTENEEAIENEETI